jgi:hypothetical protein
VPFDGYIDAAGLCAVDTLQIDQVAPSSTMAMTHSSYFLRLYLCRHSDLLAASKVAHIGKLRGGVRTEHD